MKCLHRKKMYDNGKFMGWLHRTYGKCRRCGKFIDDDKETIKKNN